MKKNKELDSDLATIPDASPYEDALSDIPDETPAGQASLNEPTGPSMGQMAVRSSQPFGALAEQVLPGLPKVVEQIPGALKKTAQTMIEPENLIPTAVSIANPVMAPVLAPASAMAYELLKGAKRPESVQELILSRSLSSISPAVSLGMQVEPSAAKKALGQGAINAVSEALPFGLAGSLKGKVIPEITRTFEETGVKPSLTQVTRESGVAKFLDFLSGGVFASTSKEAKKQANLRIMSKATKELAKDIAGEVSTTLSREEIGNSLREGIEDIGMKAQKSIEDALYKRVDQLTGGRVEVVYEVPSPGIDEAGYVPRKKRYTTEGQVPPETTISPVYPEVTDQTRKDLAPTGTSLEKPGIGSKIPPLSEKDMGKEQVNVQTAVPVERVVGAVEVPTTDIKRHINSLPRTAWTKRAVRLANNIMNEDRTLSFNDMKSLRSDLIRISEDTSADTSAQGLAKGLISVITDSMDRAAQNAGDDVYKAWKSASAFSREGFEDFKTDLMARLVLNDNKQATNIGEGIYRRGNVNEIREVRKAIKRAEELTNEPQYRALIEEARANAERNPYKKQQYEELLGKKVKAKELEDNLKAGYYNEFLNRHRIENPDYPGEVTYNFAAMKHELTDERKTVETLKALGYTNDELARLNRLMDAGSKLQEKMIEKDIPFYRMLSSTVGTVFEGALGSGYGFARFIQSPTGVKYLTEGLNSLSRGTRTTIQQGISQVAKAAYYLLAPQQEENVQASNP